MSVSAYEAPRATPIYSFAALKTKQREIKDRAAEEVVHITENGNAAYIFCSEDVLAQEKARAVEEALYERRVMEVPWSEWRIRSVPPGMVSKAFSNMVVTMLRTGR